MDLMSGFMGGGDSSKETSSLIPKTYNELTGAFEDALADDEISVADLMELSDDQGYCHDGLITRESHGLTVGRWYYLDQTTPGAYTDTKPTSGVVQQLFFVEDEDTIHLDIEEAYSVDQAEFIVYLDTDADRTAIANPEGNTLYVVKDSDGNGNNKSRTYDGDNLMREEVETEFNSTYTSSNAGHVIGSHDDGRGTVVDVEETITSHGAVVIDNTNPLSPEVTIPYNQEGGTVENIVFNLPIPAETVTNITSLNTGNLIGTYNAEDAATYDINETITDFGTPLVDNTTLNSPVITLPYNQEGGTTQNVDISLTLNPTTRVIYSEEYFAKTTDGSTQSGNRNLTITRSGVGQRTAVLSPAHPDGVDYHPSIMAEEQIGNRDGVDIHIVQGTQTATGFDYILTTGDNGGAADVFVDTPHTIGIDAPVTILENVTLS